jgi:hypothetical protein
MGQKKIEKILEKELDFTEYIMYIELMSRKKSKMGRPPLKAKDKRTAIVTLRLKKTDRSQLEKEAKARGLSLSSFLLECWHKTRRKGK